MEAQLATLLLRQSSYNKVPNIKYSYARKIKSSIFLEALVKKQALCIIQLTDFGTNL